MPKGIAFSASCVRSCKAVACHLPKGLACCVASRKVTYRSQTLRPTATPTTSRPVQPAERYATSRNLVLLGQNQPSGGLNIILLAVLVPVGERHSTNPELNRRFCHQDKLADGSGVLLKAQAKTPHTHKCSVCVCLRASSTRGFAQNGGLVLAPFKPW